VARTAGVSTASASRALTRPELVSDALRERVLYAASALGYAANSAARALSARRSGLVGAVVGGLADPVTAEILRAAEARLSAGGIGLLISVASRQAAAEACARALSARGVDGLLFIGCGAVPEPAHWGPGRALPSVNAGQQSSAGAMPAARGMAWERGLDLVQAYLRQIGHRRIGVVTGSWEEGGNRQALPHGESTSIEQRVDQLHDTDAVRAAVALLLQSEVTAIVAASDAAAAAALRECRARNRAVPQHVSIVGWGDTGLARCLSPTLTSARVPTHQTGEAAAECLLAAIAGTEYSWPDLPVKLVIRESSGPAPG
jgi:LacI family transcriptional regulator